MKRPLRAMLFIAALGPLASAAQESPEAPWNWTSTSRDGKLALVQTASAPKTCVVKCLKDPGQEVVWQANSCITTRDKVRIVSDDCERILVIDPSPVDPGTWRNAAVITAFQRAAAKEQILACDIFQTDAKLVHHPKGTQWLKGDLKVPIPAPQLLDSGLVELQLIDGRKMLVGVDGKLVSPTTPAVDNAPAKTPPPKRKPGHK